MSITELLPAILWTVVPIGIAGLATMILWPRVWITCFFLSLGFFLSDTGDGLSAQEVLIGTFAVVSVVGWIIWRIAANPKHLIRNWFDVLLLLYICLSFFNIIIAAANQVPPLSWASEWSYLLLMLYYFPIRELYGESDKDTMQFLLIGAIAAVIMSFVSLYQYKMNAQTRGLLYAYQIWSSRSALFGPFFLLTMVISLCMVFHLKGKWRTTFIYIVFAINTVAFVMTFNRTVWVLFFICMAVVLPFLRFKQNVRFLTTSIAVTAIVISGASLYYPQVTNVALNVIKKRFQSSTQLTGGDYSFQSRLEESDAAIIQTKAVPLGGNGLRAKFFSRTSVSLTAARKSFIHIGYVSLYFKLGIPMTVLFLAILGVATYQQVRAVFYFRKYNADPLIRSISIAMLAYSPALFGTILLAGIVDTWYGNVWFAVIFALTGLVNDRVMRLKVHGNGT